MELKLSDVLPLLQTISKQQTTISERLHDLIQTFKVEPEPVEPTLRVLLKPMKDGMTDMEATLTKPKPAGSGAASATSSAKGSSAPPTA